MWFDDPNKVLLRDLHSSHSSGKIPGQMGNSFPVYQPEAQAFCSPFVSFEIPNNSDVGRPHVDSVDLYFVGFAARGYETPLLALEPDRTDLVQETLILTKLQPMTKWSTL